MGSLQMLLNSFDTLIENGADPSFKENVGGSVFHFALLGQCSPYQAVTGKIYRLKQHFLPPATAFLPKLNIFFKKYASCDPIRSS